MAQFDSTWDATSFFQHLTSTNVLARSMGFLFCRVSGLDGFEEALANMQSATNFVCVSDTDNGYTELNNTPRTRRVKTVFFAMRHQIDNMSARQQCMDTMHELFQQYMSVLVQERTRLAENFIYLDPRISFNEVDRYFFSGCACAFFQIAVDVYTDLGFRPAEWTADEAQS